MPVFYALAGPAAERAPEETPVEALHGAFGWTQYADHGPGPEILGHPATALELGSGRGNAVAAPAGRGVRATGVDFSPAHCAQARTRWGHLPGARSVQADVLDYLASAGQQWEVIYSIWGACWFTDPVRLLPLVRARLAAGGRFVFAHAPAVPGSHGRQGSYGNGFTGRQLWVYRWAYEPATWADLLNEHGSAPEPPPWSEPKPITSSR
ncbi:class I SAM-dependent methyltransferase [Streptosporangium sp. NPDC003464]